MTGSPQQMQKKDKTISNTYDAECMDRVQDVAGVCQKSKETVDQNRIERSVYPS